MSASIHIRCQRVDTLCVPYRYQDMNAAPTKFGSYEMHAGRAGERVRNSWRIFLGSRIAEPPVNKGTGPEFGCP